MRLLAHNLFFLKKKVQYHTMTHPEISVSVSWLWSIMGVVYGLLPFVMILFGTDKGAPIKRANYYSASTAIYLVSFVCTMYNSGALQDDMLSPNLLARFEALPGAPLLLAHIFIFSLLLALGSLLVTYRTSMGNVVDLIYHTGVALMLPFTWAMAAVTDDHAVYWLRQTGSFTLLLILQLYSGARSRTCMQPVYVRSVLTTFGIWVCFFFITTASGPWFTALIPFEAQEGILFATNLFFVRFVLIGSQHFASIEDLRHARAVCRYGDIHLLRAGQFEAASPSERAALRQAVHRFRPAADPGPDL